MEHTEDATKKRFVGFISARTSSSRFPQKALKTIRGRTVFEHIIDRAKAADSLDEVVLTTSDQPEDDILKEIAEKKGIRVWRGSLKDKLERWRGAAKAFDAHAIITIDGDDVFCDPELIAYGVEQMREGGADFIYASKTLACGSFTYGLTRSALEKVCEIKDSGDTEFIERYFLETGLFKTQEFVAKDPLFLNSEIRLTLDYPEDLEFFSQIFEELDISLNTVPLRRIIEFLNERPDIREINFFRQGHYLDNQAKIKHLAVKEDALRRDE